MQAAEATLIEAKLTQFFIVYNAQIVILDKLASLGTIGWPEPYADLANFWTKALDKAVENFLKGIGK